MTVRFSLSLLILAFALTMTAQSKYSGPPPPKKDLPYLVHANNLVPTEVTQAAPQDRKDETVFITPGPASSAKTPLASPIFVIDAAKVVPDKLQLFRLEVKNGNREIAFKKKGRSGNDPIQMTVTPLGGTLYKLEVVNDVPNGEYALTPEGSNDVFCFSVY